MKRLVYVMPENDRFQPYGEAVFFSMAEVDAELDAQGATGPARDDYISMLETREIEDNLDRIQI